MNSSMNLMLLSEALLRPISRGSSREANIIKRQAMACVVDWARSISRPDVIESAVAARSGCVARSASHKAFIAAVRPSLPSSARIKVELRVKEKIKMREDYSEHEECVGVRVSLSLWSHQQSHRALPQARK